VIDKPARYDDWASYVPAMVDRPWTGPLFSWRIPDHEGTQGRVLAITSWPDEPREGQSELWRYRRIVDASMHADGSPDVCLVNWVQMDYWRKPVLHPTQGDIFFAEADRRPLPWVGEF
jgi:hypothetical protein